MTVTLSYQCDCYIIVTHKDVTAIPVKCLQQSSQRRQMDLHNAIGVSHQQCACVASLPPTEQPCVSFENSDLLMLFNVVPFSAETPFLRSRQSKPVVYVFPVEHNQHVLQGVCTCSLTLGIARFYNTFSYMENWATINQMGATWIY